jgi:hypothetical protein
MPETVMPPDLADTLAAAGTLDLDRPQTAADVHAALTAALAAVHQAYRVAYNHAGGDLESDAVDGLDLAAHIIHTELANYPA